jgi:flavin reductase (DIM6/NTAB) family NADH-FMN oxidoreductase RutF
MDRGECNFPLFESVTGETQLRRAFACFPSGIVAVCARVDRPIGVVVSSFTTVSLTPPLVSLNMHRESTTWPLLRAAPRLGLSVLAAGQEDVCRRLAGDADQRFSGTNWRASAAGAVFLEGAGLWLECGFHAEIPAGDHDVILLHVHALRVVSDLEPLVFHGSQFRRLTTV